MYKKFILKSLLLIIPVFGTILSVNLRVDSALVLNDRATEMANILVSGNNAAIKIIPSNWGELQVAVMNERLKIKDSIAKDIVVFGTSRSSEINSSIFPGKTFFNCAMPGGNILDYVALYALYKRNKCLPKYLILSIDPWTFHSQKAIRIDKEIQYIADTSVPLKPDAGLVKDYQIGLAYLNIPGTDKSNFSNVHIDRILEMFSPNYFQLNLKSINDKILIKTKVDSTPSYFTIRSDGSYSELKESWVDSFFVETKSYKFVDIEKSKFFIASDTGNVYFTYFTKLLCSLKKEGVISIVYISPVNPIVFDNLALGTVAIEQKIDSFCKNNNIFRVGSFNPHKYGYDRISNFFLDAYHPVKSVVENIFYFHRNELRSVNIAL